MSYLFYGMMMLSTFCLFGVVMSALAERRLSNSSRRVHEILSSSTQLALPVISVSPKDRLYGALGWLRDHLGMSINPGLTLRFERAGINESNHQDLYLVSRMLGPLLAIVAASFSPWNRTFFMLAGPGVAYLAPDFILTRIIKSRKEKLRLSVPDAVDLLVICVDAGLGLDQAILRVALELGVRHPALQQEFLRINREQRAGMQRLEAWQSMARRNDLEELDGFVNMLAQTERFGTPIARALSEFGDGIRQKRRQRAEELAAKTTVKIIFPLVLCIFPSLFIVLLGPVGIKMSHGMLSGVK